MDTETAAEALNLFRAKPALGFSDCLMLQIAHKAGHLPPGTFDKSPGRILGTRRLQEASGLLGSVSLFTRRHRQFPKKLMQERFHPP
jgi:hypothetical protein